jgi:hypothetical protein
MFLEAGALLCIPYTVVATGYETKISVNFDETVSPEIGA